MRVKVWSGDQKDYYGEGELVDHVDVYLWKTAEGHLLTELNAGMVPTAAMIVRYGKPFIIHNNPKIKLDSGTICYGCQVWWQNV